MINVTASIDDGSYYDIQFVKLFKEFNIPITIYLVVNHRELARVKGYPELTPKQEDYIIRNCEIGSHTVTHPLLTRITKEQAIDEIYDSKVMLEAIINKPVTKFCYPRGYANPEIQKIVENAGYTSARSTLVGYLDKSENPYFEQTTLHAGCNRKEYGGKTWFAYGLDMIEQAKKQERAYYHIWLHGWEYVKNGFEIRQLKALLKEITR